MSHNESWVTKFWVTTFEVQNKIHAENEEAKCELATKVVCLKHLIISV